MKEKSGSLNFLLIPLILIASGLALGVGQAVVQWLGYENGVLSDLLFMLVGLLIVFLARDSLISFQIAVMKRW